MVYFASFLTREESDAYIEAEKEARRLCEKKKAVLEEKVKNIRDGKSKIDDEYFFQCIESMNADFEYAKLYMKGIKIAKETAMSTAGSYSVSGTYDARRLNEFAEEVVEQYGDLCSRMEENKEKLYACLSKYVEEGRPLEGKDVVYKTLVETYKTHQGLCEAAETCRDERVRRLAETCEQFIEDLKLLDEMERDEEDDDNEPRS